ncbi:hypothetical protein WA026_003183 [Henosepilachna vigintioctopunctata]|uniref:Uncharacterized protein n=1 Tax=Henosepilachna vigintioctopunctata TaxID=420089 RepID=A0AAW1TLJ0_9CUCU
MIDVQEFQVRGFPLLDTGHGTSSPRFRSNGFLIAKQQGKRNVVGLSGKAAASARTLRHTRYLSGISKQFPGGYSSSLEGTSTIFPGFYCPYGLMIAVQNADD